MKILRVQLDRPLPRLSATRLIGILLAVYLLTEFVLPAFLPAWLGGYVMRPLLWTGVAVAALRLWRSGATQREGSGASLVAPAAVAGAAQLCILVAAGIVVGFGRSPYDHSLFGIIVNVVVAGSALAGMELSRACLLRNCQVSAISHRSRLSPQAPVRTQSPVPSPQSSVLIPVPSPQSSVLSPVLRLVATALFFTLIATPAIRLTGLAGDGAIAAIPFVASMLFPALAENLLASYLAMAGGPLPALTYRGVLLAFLWLSPILPDLPWPLAAFLGTALPLAGLIVVDRLVVQDSPSPATTAAPRPAEVTPSQPL